MTSLNPCACIGPINGETHCPCTMVRLKLTRNPNQDQKLTAEAIAKAMERSVKVAEVIIKRGLKS